MNLHSYVAAELESGQASLHPEKELLLNVLQQAKDDLAIKTIKPTTKQKREKESAYAWFTKRDATWFFSFYSICEELDLDPDRMRRLIFKKLDIIGPA